jgi:NADH dehydrogenase/NADH:ubiquinone oxidoreductase subunit G
MKIKINNSDFFATEGELLIEVAHRNGIEIPSLCYTAGYNHQASCMVCMVKNCNTGQLIPACSTIVTEDMNIDSEGDEVKDLRRESLELLLSEHIAVCKPPCNIQKCKLRKYAVEYRAKWNRFPRYSAIENNHPQHITENLWFDVNKCIKCGLCVYNSVNGFTFKNRGFGMQVVLPEESVSHIDELSCEICPTQALYSKP